MAKKLSTTKIVLVVLGVLVLLTGLWGVTTYNSLVGKDETVNQMWGNVQSAYQRRADLLPNLVATVKGASDFEKKMQTDIAALRTGITNSNSPAELDLMGQKINTAINVVYENYPQIKSTEGYLKLQDQLEGTENRIKVERDLYNGAVREYSVKVRTFPSSLIAGMFNFETREMFEAAAGADVVPEVTF